MNEALIALIIARPGMAARLIAEHTDDGTGHCRVCSAGGQSGRYVYPCAIRLAADEAARRSGEVHP
jgi:hypothetical protein